MLMAPLGEESPTSSRPRGCRFRCVTGCLHQSPHPAWGETYALFVGVPHQSRQQTNRVVTRAGKREWSCRPNQYARLELSTIAGSGSLWCHQRFIRIDWEDKDLTVTNPSGTRDLNDFTNDFFNPQVVDP